MKMNKYRIVSGILLVFFLGVVIGAMGDRLFLRYRNEKLIRDPKFTIIDRFVGRLERKLDLTSNQTVQVRKIIMDMGSDFHEFREKHKEEVDSIYKTHMSQMKQCLDVEQYLKLESFFKMIRTLGSRQSRPIRQIRQGKIKDPRTDLGKP